jgi:hypothetical protein
MSEGELTTRDLAGTSAATEEQQPAPVDEPAAGRDDRDGDVAAGPTVDDAETGPLLPDDQRERFSQMWLEIQASFVDEPRSSVEQADSLVADLMQRLAAGFSNEREKLERQWDSGDDVGTEDLRVALTRYRSFFDRLLAA